MIAIQVKSSHMELRFGVNPLRSQPISKDQSSKSTKSRSKKLGKDQDARLKDSQKTKDFQKTLKNDPGGKNLEKEVEKLGKKFLFRLPVIRSNVSSEGSLHAPSHEPTSRPAPVCTTIRPTQAPSTEALHIGELLEEEAESERKTKKPGEISSANKDSVESKYPSKYPASMLMDNSQLQGKWRGNLQDEKKFPKEEKERKFPIGEEKRKFPIGEEERKFRRQLSELRPKISALTRSLNSLQVMQNIAGGACNLNDN